MKRPHGSGYAPGEGPSVLPGDLVRALDWLRQRLDQPVRLDALAEVAGVRPRTLESHFRTFLGTTPLGWVRRTRLHNARRALLASGESVTGAALANGFNQLGRFAAQYKAEFGELPSETLQRARAAEPELDDEALRLTTSRRAIASAHWKSSTGPRRVRPASASPRRWPPGAGASAPRSISARRRTRIAPARASSPTRPRRSRPTMPWR